MRRKERKDHVGKDADVVATVNMGSCLVVGSYSDGAGPLQYPG